MTRKKQLETGCFFSKMHKKLYRIGRYRCFVKKYPHRMKNKITYPQFRSFHEFIVDLNFFNFIIMPKSGVGVKSNVLKFIRKSEKYKDEFLKAAKLQRYEKQILSEETIFAMFCMVLMFGFMIVLFVFG